uniref:Selenocysteine lyase n=1 Tax=Romanomermis culicivorax TaxID=13658 RepID=A0A915IK49_ROMCU
MIYLDYNATCPLADEATTSISDALTRLWANPSSNNPMGKLARDEIEISRQNIAKMINCETSVETIGKKLSSVNADRNLKVLLHSDAAQAIGKIPVDVELLNVDYLTIVGHKAALLVSRNLSQYRSHMLEIRDYFEENLLKRVENVSVNFRDSQRLPNTSSVVFSATRNSGADLLKKCQRFVASTGAACHDSTKASAILLACGVELESARRTIRFSFGRETSKKDVDIVINELSSIILNLNTDSSSDRPLKRKSLENDQTDNKFKRSSIRVLCCDS